MKSHCFLLSLEIENNHRIIILIANYLHSYLAVLFSKTPAQLLLKLILLPI